MDVLCSVCRAVFTGKGRKFNHKAFGKMRFYSHHRDIQALKKAASENCVLCGLLWRSLSTQEKEEVQDASPKSPATGMELASISYHIRRDPYESRSSRFRFRKSSGEFITKNFCFEQLRGWPLPIQEPEEREYPHDTGSEACLKQAVKWLSDCVANHEHCKAKDLLPRILPNRLLFVGGVGDELVRLCSTECIPSDTRYVTLSHCWGQEKFINLTNSNITSFQKSISLSSLPKTFRDAIVFTRTIAVEYIWIDSLCIIQNSKDDWRRESLLMENTYTHAYCNIAATSGSDSKAGCFFKRDVANCKPLLFQVEPLPLLINAKARAADLQEMARMKLKRTLLRKSDDSEFLKPGTWTCHDRGAWQREITDSVLLKRAWVFQERILAKRVLHFTSVGIFFECRQHCASELLPEGMIRPHNQKNLKQEVEFSMELEMETGFIKGNLRPREAVLGAWTSIVDHYSTCELTFETDRLIAVAGLARKIKPLIKSKYVAGLWEEGIAKQLLWISSVEGTKSETYQAPTWSWASRPGKVMTSTLPSSAYLSKSLNQLLEVLDVDVLTTDGNEMSQVIYGCIKLRAILIPIYLDPILLQFAPTKYPHQPPIRRLQIRKSIFHFSFDIAPSSSKLDLSETVYICPCFLGKNDAQSDGLMLRPTGNKKGEYERIGSWSYNWESDPYDVPDSLLGKGTEEERVLMWKSTLWEAREEFGNDQADVFTFTIV